jgi:nucleoside-diphosphate-sugar epimerase
LTATDRRALVTGAAGFVGSHLVDALLAEGVPVRALVRPTSDRRYLDPARVEFASGDVTDTTPVGGAALVRACEGIDVVYHAAGVVQARRVGEFHAANADGAGRMARAAQAAGVRRFVLVSSQAAGGPSPGDAPRDETVPDRPLSAYGESKRAGELAALAAHPDVVIVRPPGVYGPRDTAFLRLFQLVSSGFAPLPGGPGQRLSLVHAHDLAAALVLAAGRGRAGERYYVTSGPPLTAGELLDAVARALAKKPLRVSVPLGMLEAVAGLAEAWSAMRGQAPRITRERVKDWAASGWTVDDAKARAQLGYVPGIDLAQGIEETAAWYRTAGWI